MVKEIILELIRELIEARESINDPDIRVHYDINIDILQKMLEYYA